MLLTATPLWREDAMKVSSVVISLDNTIGQGKAKKKQISFTSKSDSVTIHDPSTMNFRVFKYNRLIKSMVTKISPLFDY